MIDAIEGFLRNGIASVATFFLVAAYIPQVVKTFRTKDVTGVSLPFWILINIALTLLWINALYLFLTTGVYGYLITESFNESLALVMLVMTIKYRRKEAVQCRKFT